jgi:hypothetical protein
MASNYLRDEPLGEALDAAGVVLGNVVRQVGHGRVTQAQASATRRSQSAWFTCAPSDVGSTFLDHVCSLHADALEYSAAIAKPCRNAVW